VEDLLRIEHDGAVRTVTLMRARKRNAINPAMMQAIREAFEAQPRSDERVTVLRGEGTAFCSGLQLSSAGVDEDEARRIEAMFDAVQRYPLPVVAVVQGPAIAGGCELALHCDFVVAARDAPLAMPLAQLGVTTTWFLTKKIIEAAGPAVAREFLLLGEPMSGARLHQLGIVARSADAPGLEAEVDALVQRLAGNAPLAMRTMKAMLIKQMSFLLAIEHDEFDAPVREVFASRDAREGVAARVERRTALFTGQ
jgi:enoyl-CoA hydratase/carnithine racemase